jgi:hypothetical protein
MNSTIAYAIQGLDALRVSKARINVAKFGQGKSEIRFLFLRGRIDGYLNRS